MIKTSNLNFFYKNHQAIKNLNLTIEQGSFVAILGANGSGKSTLAKLLNGLLSPTSGNVEVFGLSTTNENNIWDIRKNVGMVFQNPDNQIIASVVEEDIAFGLENLGIPQKEMHERINTSLKTVHMEKYQKDIPSKLSGGQKQKIAIASVIAMKPKCIVFDEATAMLDPKGRKNLIEIIKDLKQQGITIVLITHFMEETITADKIIVMEKGQIALEGAPKDVFYHTETLKKLELDVPEMTQLATMLYNSGFNIDKNILDTKEMITHLSNINPQHINSSNFIKENPNQDDFSSFNKCNFKTIDDYLKTKNLTHIFSKGTSFEKKALDNISINIQKSKITCLIGHTGSGKSTLIQHFNRLLKPTSGNVMLDDFDINSDKTKLKTIRQKIGLVFQYPEHQLFEETIYKDIAYGPKNMGLDESEIDQRVKYAINLVGLDFSIADKSPFDISGGQKRRVAIAGILAMQPEILILDEPTAGLDPKGRKNILSQIRYLHKKTNITIILVSHSMEDVARLADKIIVMDQGQVKYQGTPLQVFKNEKNLIQIGLDVPQINTLMTALNQNGINVSQNIFTVEDAFSELSKYFNEKR